MLCPPWVIPGTVIWIFLLLFPVAQSSSMVVIFTQQAQGEKREEREEMGWVITQWTAATPLKIENQ